MLRLGCFSLETPLGCWSLGRAFFCSSAKNDSIAALSPAAPTRPMEPTRPFTLSASTKRRERNCPAILDPNAAGNRPPRFVHHDERRPSVSRPRPTATSSDGRSNSPQSGSKTRPSPHTSTASSPRPSAPNIGQPQPIRRARSELSTHQIVMNRWARTLPRGTRIEWQHRTCTTRHAFNTW